MGKKHKHAKKGKLPKKIGGVKLPKDLRKAGDALIETARSPKGQQVISAGLAMVAGAASKRAGPTPPQPPIAPPPPGVAEVPPPGQPGVAPELERITEAFGAATTAFLDGFFGRKR